MTFTLGRHIEEQFKIAKEMTNNFGQKSTPCHFLYSVDLRKALDTISWATVDDILAAMGFVEDLCHIIG